MANYCDYEVRVKGSKKAGLMVYESMPCMDFMDFYSEEKVGGSYLITFTGNCKWSVNYGVNDHLSKVNLDSMSESDIKDKGVDYWEYSLRAKSEAFQCEIMVHYWSEESGFDQFDHYKNGKVIKQRKIEYNYEEENVFDWDKTEFVGHEGEYDESVDGEQHNENLMAMLMGLGGMAPSREPETSDEDQEKLADLTGELGDLLGQLEGMIAEAGIDLDDGSIGETGFDMYKWTFTEGKTAKGNGWTIAIPDGFVQIKSNDVEPISGKKRLFELVPMTCKDEKNYDNIPVRILPGGEQDGPGLANKWMVHPNARAGIACILGSITAQYMSQMMGQAPGLLSAGWSDVAAHIMVQDTSGGSYGYHCSIITEKKNQMLSVQTQFVREAQKHSLDLSILAWLKTMKFDKPNKACPTKTKFEEDACFNELLKGKTTKFEEAIEQAKTEYLASVNGNIKGLEFMAENGLLDKYTGESIKRILEDGMDVKLFFMKKADELIKKLQKKSVPASVIEDMMQILSDLEEDCTEFNFDDEKIEIDVPKPIQDIRDKWKKASLSLTNGKLSKAKENVAEAKAEVDPENEKKKTIETEVSTVKAKYNQTKSELQPQIDELEKKQKALEDAHTQEEKAFKTTEEQRKKDIKASEAELEKAQATFEVISEIADFWEEKVDKGGFSKKKNQAMYSEKKAEAERAKAKVDEILEKISDIKTKLQEENARHSSNLTTYSSEKSQIESEIAIKKKSLENASSELDKAKKKLDDQTKVVDKKKKAVKKAEKEVTAIEKEIAKLEKGIKKIKGK